MRPHRHRLHLDAIVALTSQIAVLRPLALAIAIVCTASSEIGSQARHEPASQPVRAEHVEGWLQSAEQALRVERYAEALPAFERALGAAQQLGLETQRAAALLGLAEIDFARANYASARERGEAAIAIYERRAGGAGTGDDALGGAFGRANIVLSRVAEREGDQAEATKRAERAVAAYEAAGDRRGRALAALQLVRTAVLGLDEERQLTDRVIADARAVSDRAIEGKALHSFGDELFTKGQYAESLVKLEAAAALIAAAGGPVALGTVYNSLGRLYRAHGRLDAALAHQLKALALHEQSSAPYNQMVSLNAVAVTYQSLGDSRHARTYFERAVALADTTGTVMLQDFVRANFALTLIEDGDYQQAADVLEGVLARGLDRFPALRMRELAYAYMKLGRLDAASAWAQKSVDACGAREGLTCIQTLDRRAEIHAALGNDTAALEDLRTAMTAIEAVRARLVPVDFFKQQFHLAQDDLYSRTIAMQFRRGQRADALESAERARARAFVDLLASRDLAPAASGASAAGIAATAARDATPAAGRDLLSNRVATPASSAELMATAARLRSTLLMYWVTNTQVFIWVASPDGTLRSAQTEVRLSSLLELIRATTPLVNSDRRGAREPGPDGPAPRGAAAIAIPAQGTQAWRELYDLLIRPVRGALPRSPGALLTIVPHGPLGVLPFAGLQDGRGRYLLEDYTLHYAPSGAALQFTAATRRTDSRRGSMLIVADPTPPTLSPLDRPLPRLPGARSESRAIAALVPRTRVTQFEGDRAREPVVREAAAGKAVLHFATHAIVRDDDPFSSFLALTRSGTDDGLLTAQEIYRLRLDADLVVLSACRSAGGRVTGDGIATFVRAFIYAGAPSIVASLWDVADEPTNRLLPQFYRRWLGGASKARALRAAQLQLLKQLRAGVVRIETPAGLVTLPEHPVFWAGFSLIGEPD